MFRLQAKRPRPDCRWIHGEGPRSATFHRSPADARHWRYVMSAQKKSHEATIQRADDLVAQLRLAVGHPNALLWEAEQLAAKVREAFTPKDGTP